MRLKLEQLVMRRGEFELSLDLEWHAPVLLLRGASGAGKSLLLRLLAGLEKPQTGRILADDRCWADSPIFVPPHQRPISLMFQDYRLFPHLDVMANLCFGGASPATARELAARFGIEALLGRRVNKLSGGEKQRVALLRTLLKPARLVLLDEPLSALDPELRSIWLEQLQKFRQHKGIQLVYVSHHQEEMQPWTDAAQLALSRGHVVEYSNNFK